MDSHTVSRIRTLSEQGEQKRVNEQYAEAEALFDQAVQLVPEPQEAYPIYSWLLFSLAEVTFYQGRADEAFVLLMRVKQLGHLDEEPDFHFLLGKCSDALTHEDLAIQHLKEALRLGGKQVFDGEHPRWYALATGKPGEFRA